MTTNPTVKLVDERGRTVCLFRRQDSHGAAVTPEQTRHGVDGYAAMAGRGPYWSVVQKPHSRQRRGRIDAQFDANDGIALVPAQFAHSAYPVVFDDAGMPVRLEIPGLLSLRWDKVVRVLDAVAGETENTTLTVVQFRRRFDT